MSDEPRAPVGYARVMRSTALLALLVLVPLASCLPSGPGTADEWLDGAPSGCEVSHTSSIVTPDTWRDDRGHNLAPHEGTQCAEGAEPHPQLEICADAPGPCACRWICRPECALTEVCNEDGSCACHPSYEAGPFGCMWPGLHHNGGFDSCDGWRFDVATGNADSPPTADVEGGRLHLALTHPCTAAAASATVRVPARSELAGGAALVFDYVASDARNPPEDTRAIVVSFDDRFFSPPPADEPRTHRECVRLEELPRLAGIAFHMARMGACFPEELTDWHFLVDNVRLEAAPECADE